MALPFIPAEEIPEMFQQLERQVGAAGDRLQAFTEYVRDTWVDSTMWPPSTWSVFLQAIRTNNDVEHWHLGLNRRATLESPMQLPFYILIQLLHREARLTSLHIRLVSERKLRRIQRKKYCNLQTKIFSLLEGFTNGERSARRLLKACSYLNGPTE